MLFTITATGYYFAKTADTDWSTMYSQHQNDYYNQQLAKIRRGGSHHYAEILDQLGGLGSSNLGPVSPPVVVFGQDDDPHYTQYLQNWQEVNALISNIIAAAEKAWGPNDSTWL
jgi:hypothetical protein